LFGKAKYLELRRNFSGALDVINEAVVLFSQSIPALLEKMKLQVALQDWEQAVDTAQRWSIYVFMHYAHTMSQWRIQKSG